MIDQALLDRSSQHALDRGVRLLQGFRLDATDESHIARLLEFMRPARGQHWLDIGSGFGEAARLMQAARPDLRFTLINNSRYQLCHTPAQLDARFGDMHALPFDDEEFDGAMFLYSLCHADDFQCVLSEAARVVRPGGALFVFDYLRRHGHAGDDALTIRFLQSRFMDFFTMQPTLEASGWSLQKFGQPVGSDALFRDLVDGDPMYDTIFAELVPVLWRAVRP
jgi:ubiquinone/menaquinone biosynthesis C-methylase UbiE